VNSFLKLNGNLQSKNLCGLYPLKSDFFLIGNMNYFISIDSGNAHIASITKVPTLVIMSAANPPGKWTPINAKIINVHCDCAGMGYFFCKQNNQLCILTLSPSSVFKKFIELSN
jgi:ADP-heptose:LPS heptosyltransferase